MDILAGSVSHIKVPSAADNIYSEECVYSYDTPVSRLQQSPPEFVNKNLFTCRSLRPDCTSVCSVSWDSERIMSLDIIRKADTPCSFTSKD